VISRGEASVWGSVSVGARQSDTQGVRMGDGDSPVLQETVQLQSVKRSIQTSKQQAVFLQRPVSSVYPGFLFLTPDRPR
jgi:hypothetical protein